VKMQRRLGCIYDALEALPIHKFEDKEGVPFRVTLSEEGFFMRVIPTFVWGSCSFTVEICFNGAFTARCLDLSIQSIDDQVLDATLGERSTYMPPRLKVLPFSRKTAFLAEGLCMADALRVLTCYLSLFQLDLLTPTVPLGERSYYKRPDFEGSCEQ